MDKKKIEAAAQVIAAYELYDWASLPDDDPSGKRDRNAFRQIAQDALNAANGAH